MSGLKYQVVACLVAWAVLERAVAYVSGPKYSSKWNANIVSSFHNITVVMLCCYFLMYDMRFAINIIPYSCSYFMFDIKNFSYDSFYFQHHIATIFAICFWFRDISHVSMPCVVAYYMLMEIGNWGIYMTYGFMVHPDKDNIKCNFDALLLCEFVWYFIFRVYTPSVMLAAHQYYDGVTGYAILIWTVILTAGNALLSYKLYLKIIHRMKSNE